LRTSHRGCASRGRRRIHAHLPVARSRAAA
jgi:hypothetical protein